MCIVQRSVGKSTEKLGGGPEGEGKNQQVLQIGLFKGSSFSASTDSTEYTHRAPCRSPWPNAIIQQVQGSNVMLGKVSCTLVLLQRQRQSRILHRMLEESLGSKERSPRDP